MMPFCMKQSDQEGQWLNMKLESNWETLQVIIRRNLTFVLSENIAVF